VWAFPLVAALVALAFALLLARQFAARRRPYQALWALALLMYAIASATIALGVWDGWSVTEYKVYWALGAVLNVPFLAQGEIHLLAPRRVPANALLLLLLFGTAFAVARIRSSVVDVTALAGDLPSGSEAYDTDPFALTLARIYSFSGYFVLLAGTLWSAWRMRGRSDLRDRFTGTLLIAVGATVVAAGSAFAAAGNAPGFSLTLLAGISVMFWGFLRASRQRATSARDRTSAPR
jgi:hypothetical protein